MKCQKRHGCGKISGNKTSKPCHQQIIKRDELLQLSELKFRYLQSFPCSSPCFSFKGKGNQLDWLGLNVRGLFENSRKLYPYLVLSRSRRIFQNFSEFHYESSEFRQKMLIIAKIRLKCWLILLWILSIFFHGLVFVESYEMKKHNRERSKRTPIEGC